jgi:PleD family two-component response regulator
MPSGQNSSMDLPRPGLTNPRDLIDRADQALYTAQKDGRNQVKS